MAPSTQSGTHVSEGDRLLAAFDRHGGVMARKEIRLEGFGSRALYRLIEDGQVVRGAHGVYRLAEQAPFGTSAYALATHVVPTGIVALLSALVYHNLTTQIEDAVYLAVPRMVRATSSEVPIKLVVMPGRLLTSSVERVRTESGERFTVFSRERAICDSFAHPKLVPEGVVYEALRRYLDRDGRDLPALERAAMETRTDALIFPVLKTWQAG